MLRGIVLGFLSYAVFSWGDAAVKALGGRLPVFEISFFVTLFALIALPAVRPRHENWRDMFRMHRPGLILLRSVSGMTAGILGVVAFTTLPFAEAYALIFLSPVFATLLSVIFLGERIGWRRSLAIVVGFAGVLIVVRPGFRELQVGHFAAIAVALCAAITVIVLRTLGPTEKRITLMGVPLVLSLVVTGLLTTIEFRPPNAVDYALLLLAGVFAGIGHILILAATRAAPANRIAPGQYSQIVWAVLLGALFFGEFPDAFALMGMALVAAAGLVTFIREEKVGKAAVPVPSRITGEGAPGEDDD